MDSPSLARSMRGSIGMLADPMKAHGGAPFAETRSAIEAAANRLQAPDFDTLTEDSHDEFRAPAEAALAHASAKLTPTTSAVPPKD